MQEVLEKFASSISNLNERVGKSISWLCLIVVLVVCIDVLRRYFFNDSAIWITELEWHLFGFLFLLTAGYTLKHDRHVRVDLFYEKMEKKNKAQVDLIGHLFFLIPWSLCMMLISFRYGLDSWNINEGSPNPNGLPARYIIKFSIFLGFLLLLLQGIAEAIKTYFITKNK